MLIHLGRWILLVHVIAAVFPALERKGSSELYSSTRGNSTYEECNGRGVCDRRKGECKCARGFGPVKDRRGRFQPCAWCGEPGEEPSCPTDLDERQGILSPPCSGHGNCDSSSGRCSCYSGWIGIACSDRVCPRDVSWDRPQMDEYGHSECSDKGVCDRLSGICDCVAPFFGDACQNMKCSKQGCSGHGNCLPMRSLAERYSDFKYGTPSLPSTWDADKIYGCGKCDEGYTGYDCSQKRCTTAENGMKYEIQKFHCHVRPGEDGHQPSFKLSFGPSHSQPIPANASLDELASSLRLLPTIHNVSISLSNTDASRICSTNDTRWEISVEFLDAVTHGHLLMPLGFDESKLHVSSAIRVQTLDAVVDECNGHGLCSPETGLCTCSEAWRGSYDCGKRSSTQT
eukprot:gb/GECG01003866.1/.p1 GENE.gb/GECG01003866.1/~~gb/GECG01003866.1/.p1  ORF type:complete len:400 (+),score=16.58 gb/GECG01003866.1/:1-1200(+)